METKRKIAITIKDGLVFFLIGFFIAGGLAIGTMAAVMGMLLLGLGAVLATLTVGFFYLRIYINKRLK